LLDDLDVVEVKKLNILYKNDELTAMLRALFDECPENFLC